MADARVTSLGVYVEEDPVDEVRVTSFGVYVEEEQRPEIWATSFGVYVEREYDPTTIGAHEVQVVFRVGPPFRRDTDDAFWDWSVLRANLPYTPIAATTLADDLDPAETSATLADASAYPDAGGIWVGPNGDGESWEYVKYTGKNGDTLTGLVRETVDGEQTGMHSAGAVVKFWWELDTADAGFEFDHEMDTTLSVAGWAGRLRGVVAPVAALRTGHLLLAQARWLYAGAATWSEWRNLLVGWLRSPTVADDADRVRSWNVDVVGLNGVLGEIEVTGLRVGDEDAARRGTATASSILTAAYKEAGTGEFTAAAPALSPNKAVDGLDSTPWIADGYVGEDNPANHDGGVQAITSERGVTQFHVSPYTGQGDGYRWAEITGFSATNLDQDWLIAGLNKFVNFEESGISIPAGERVLLVENPALFQDENPETKGAQIIDLSEYTLWDLNNAIYEVDAGAATSGTFTLEVEIDGDGNPAEETDPIAYDATAADVQSALEGLSIVDAGEVRVSGAAGGPWTITFVNDLGSNPATVSVGTDSTSGGTGVTATQVQNGGNPFATAEDGSALFDYLPASGGMLRLYNGPAGQGQSQVVWGTETGFGTWAPNWTGDALAAPGAGETARMIFDGGGSPTVSADYWAVGRVATPGYSVVSGDSEWWLLGLPSMGLSLTDDVTDADPPNGGDLAISNAAGPSVDGLDASGTLQVGSEQIAYTGKKADNSAVTGITRGANGTAAAAHSAGDTIYQVVGGEAIDALPIKQIDLVRPSGLMVLEDFVVRRGRLSSARSPEQTNYTADYYDEDTVTTNALATYSIDLTGAPERIRWLLVEISKMGTQPARPRLNSVKAQVSEDVYASANRMASGTVGAAIAKLLDNAGVPASAYTDAGNTQSVDGYTTATDLAWTVIADLADKHQVRVTVGKDSHVRLEADPYWATDAFTPAETSELKRISVSNVRYLKPSGRGVGQVVIWWRTPADPEPQRALFPESRDGWGQVVTIGSEASPEVFADETQAQAVAKKRFYLLRRGYMVVAQVAGIGADIEPGSVRGLKWDLSGADLDHDRTYLVIGASHAPENFGWDTVLRLLQISREDDR